MTEKTLDERVAEALGLEVHKTSGNIKLIAYLGHKMVMEPVEGFFTNSTANCEKYIEPALLGLGRGLEITYIECFREWNVESRLFLSDGKMFKGIGETKSIAYCTALLDLKERERNET